MFSVIEIQLTLPKIIGSIAEQFVNDTPDPKYGSLSAKSSDADIFWPAMARAMGRTPDHTDLVKLYELVGDQSDKYLQRWFQSYTRWSCQYAAFKEYLIPPVLAKATLGYLPKVLLNYKPNIALQICHEPGIVPVHIDHNRSCSILFILNTNHEQTRWWQQTHPFESIKNFNFPEIDCIELVDEQTLQSGKTYVFNQSAYHSVHPTMTNSTNKRAALCVEFNDLSAEELYQLLHEYH